MKEIVFDKLFFYIVPAAAKQIIITLSYREIPIDNALLLFQIF